jgi:hypothetical protein
MDNVAKKIWSVSELENFERTIHKVLEENDWRDGHKFHTRIDAYLNNIGTRILTNAVELSYDIIYCFDKERTEKHTECFTPGNVMSIYNHIDDIEMLVRLHSRRLNAMEHFNRK